MSFPKLSSFAFQGSISFLDRLAFRKKWNTDIKFGSVYVLFCISSSTILVIDIEFLELQARDTLQNICTGPISNASFVRLSISVKSIWKIVDLFVMEFCSGNLMDEIKAKFHRHPDKLSFLASMFQNTVKAGYKGYSVEIAMVFCEFDWELDELGSALGLSVKMLMTSTIMITTVILTRI
ncbi:alpha,alpha-trehalose-phosphate synthase [UDP-forming] [Trifolium repens]|nr:alpha,alpha-trehalose-phosphate synthase [UDP-forming] [Trifolium repens]